MTLKLETLVALLVVIIALALLVSMPILYVAHRSANTNVGPPPSPPTLAHEKGELPPSHEPASSPAPDPVTNPVTNPVTRPATSTPASRVATARAISVTQPAAQSPDFLDVIEAVFRYQFDHNVSGRQRTANSFFLCLGRFHFEPNPFPFPATGPATAPVRSAVIGQDPPPALIARFAGEIPPVFPISMAVITDHRLSHQSTGGTGLIFQVLTIEWLDQDTANVTGGYWEGLMSSSFTTYQAHRENGKWVVTRIEPEVVS